MNLVEWIDWIVLAFILLMPAGWIGGIADVRRRDSAAFAATGRSRTAWLFAIAIGGIAGAVVYLSLVRPSVRRAEDSLLLDLDRSGVGDDEDAAWRRFSPRRK